MQLKSLALAATALTGIAVSSPAQAQPAGGEAARIQALEAQIQQLQQAVTEMKEQQAAAPAAAPTPTVTWKGAPQIADKEGGWSFKPRGRLMYDFATVDGPQGYDNAGLGFSNEVRRARLGVEGSLPGDFGYKFEVDVATG